MYIDYQGNTQFTSPTLFLFFFSVFSKYLFFLSIIANRVINYSRIGSGAQHHQKHPRISKMSNITKRILVLFCNSVFEFLWFMENMKALDQIRMAQSNRVGLLINKWGPRIWLNRIKV